MRQSQIEARHNLRDEIARRKRDGCAAPKKALLALYNDLKYIGAGPRDLKRFDRIIADLEAFQNS